MMNMKKEIKAESENRTIKIIKVDDIADVYADELIEVGLTKLANIIEELYEEGYEYEGHFVISHKHMGFVSDCLIFKKV